MADLQTETNKRRTFAIISHPDAGKTTLTEKLLLFGGAIQLAGTVKGRKAARHATSDWMELEKQRGISVTSSVMQFDYKGEVMNLLDTPGTFDFAGEAVGAVSAADLVVFVVDASSGLDHATVVLWRQAAERGITEKEREAQFLEFISLKCWIDPTEVGDLAVFLASYAGRHITGQEIGMDGNVEWEI